MARILENSIRNYYENANCGKWTENYALMHKSSLSGAVQNPRFVASVAVRAGLADNLKGLVTQFLFAILANRAFLRVSFGNLPRMEDVFDAPYINWTAIQIPPHTYACMKPPYKNVSVTPEVPLVKCLSEQRNLLFWNNMSFYPMHLVNDEQLMYMNKNLSEIIPNMNNINVILYSGNRGRTISSFKNIFHKNQLLSMGLRPETTFSCLFHYLFRINKNKVCTQPHCKIIYNTISNLNPINHTVIGIHVRLPDAVFRNENTASISTTKFHFRCAEEYAASLPKSQKWTFFLVTNSMRLRNIAKSYYKNKIITDTYATIQHTGEIVLYYV